MQKDFSLAIIFMDKMVFQADKPLKIFGTAEKDLNIKISLLAKDYEFNIKKGEFCVDLPSLPVIKVGFTIKVSGGGTVYEIKDCLVGDVFICAGQSNMAFIVNDCININQVPNNLIRSFEVPKRPHYGLEEKPGWEFLNNYQWLIAESDNIKWFSAIGYLVASSLQKEKDIPIGIISLNMGDTTVFTWIDEVTLSENKRLKYILDNYYEEIKKFKTEKEYDDYFNQQLPLLYQFYGLLDEGVRLGLSSEEAHRRAFEKVPNPYLPMGPKNQNRPCGLFDTMVKRVIPYQAKAILYYQGENDKLNYEVYKEAMNTFTLSWRKAFKSELPIIITQIAGYEYVEADPLAVSYLRREQAKFLNIEEQKYVITAADCGERYDIHPHDKNEVARRFVGVLNEFVYHTGCNSLSPMYDSHQLIGDKLVIRVKNNQLPLKYTDKNCRFTVITKTGKVKEVKIYQLLDQEIVVLLEEEIVELRYAFNNYPEMFIYTENDLPLLPFQIKFQ
jgi:sialate O-acetylesterase